jgi:BirA family transcriptional regulator, biotin operon repressor / biotin---[acetyl-CoA-carboxylase] ligase
MPLSKNPRDRSLKSRDSTSPTTSWPFVRTIVERDVVDSTNDVAAELLREGGVALPLAVRADRQTRGRGRGGHAWWSDEGSLTFTLAIDPDSHGLARVLEPMVALSTAVAVIDALDELGFGDAAIGIRWPNDLECPGGKLGGILPEAIELKDARYLLVGVGLNVTTNLGEAPGLVKAMATSLAAVSAGPIEADLTARLLAAIFRHFESVLSRLVLGDRELRARWNVLDLLRNCPVRVDVGSHVVAGMARGIDEEGALCVDDGKEALRLFGGTVLRSAHER